MSTICRRPPSCTICTLHYLHYALCTLHCALCSISAFAVCTSTIFTMQYTLCTIFAVHYALCTMYYAQEQCSNTWHLCTLLAVSTLLHCFIYSYSVAISYNLNWTVQTQLAQWICNPNVLQQSNCAFVSSRVVESESANWFCHLASEIANQN